MTALSVWLFIINLLLICVFGCKKSPEEPGNRAKWWFPTSKGQEYRKQIAPCKKGYRVQADMVLWV